MRQLCKAFSTMPFTVNCCINVSYYYYPTSPKNRNKALLSGLHGVSIHSFHFFPNHTYIDTMLAVKN